MSPTTLRAAAGLAATMSICILGGCSDPKNAAASNGSVAVPVVAIS